MTAREYFEALSSAARDREALRARVEAMAEPYVGSSLSQGGGGQRDAMSRYDAQIDAEAAMAAQLAQLDAMLDDGRRVLDGIGRELGQQTALMLELHYLCAASWFEVSIELGVSMATCYRRRREAFGLWERAGLAALRDMGGRTASAGGSFSPYGASSVN